MRSRPGARGKRTLAQPLALLFGLAFLLIGILGFVPWITVNYGDLKLAGSDSGAELLGLFQVSVLHNAAHLLFGVGVVAARRPVEALQFLLTAGLLYVLLSVYGLIARERGSENFLPTNKGDDWLHLTFAVALVGAWIVARAASERESQAIVGECR